MTVALPPLLAPDLVVTRTTPAAARASSRAAAPLIVVKCYNGPAADLQEEFFGSVDGDNQPTAGKLELAMGCTLFLDEVEKLPVDFGDKLADVLQNGLPAGENGAEGAFAGAVGPHDGMHLPGPYAKVYSFQDFFFANLGV